ncbi:MAG: AAA family ATPase, partial [Acidimicrobiales bacterium]
MTGPAGAPEEAAAAVETHVSTLFFLRDRVYKLCKPVSLGFLDYSTRERRLEACRREVELNRRLAPDVYLGVYTVLDDAGAPCEHLVAMRRMPADRRLTALLDTPEAADRVRDTARALAAFHAGAARTALARDAAEAASLRALWADNAAELARHPQAASAAELVRAERLAGRYLDGRAGLLAERAARGLAVDGHGDLLADDIFCLPDGPRLLDCLAFDDRLRAGDVLLDAAFLAMDLERLGRADLAAAFLDWYREFSGERHPRSLADHFVAYRAQVRAKVAAIRAAQAGSGAGAGAGGAAWAAASSLHRLCLGHLEAARVRLVLVGGAPGVGKSTVAEALGRATGWAVLRSDEIRKELLGVDRLADLSAPLGQGAYRPETTVRTYQELARRAGALAARGESAILDASWLDPVRRAELAAAAEAAAADLVELQVQAPPALAAARIRARRAAGGDPSDATEEVA